MISGLWARLLYLMIISGNSESNLANIVFYFGHHLQQLLVDLCTVVYHLFYQFVPKGMVSYIMLHPLTLKCSTQYWYTVDAYGKQTKHKNWIGIITK
jgi:cadmium resistance protein CadD (predicted permease)